MSRSAGRLAGILIGLCASASLVLSDGGTVQFQKQVGPFLVTLFSSPAPLRVGVADLSVLVQRAEDRTDVLDCRVTLRLAKPGEQGIRVDATRAQATNKLLYAASAVLPEPGKWSAEVEISANGRTFQAPGELDVSPPQPRVITYWPYFVLPAVAVLLFVLNQWLKARRNIRNRPGRP